MATLSRRTSFIYNRYSNMWNPRIKILRCDLKTHNVIRERIDGCNNYILPSTADYGLFKSNCLTFKANKTIKFTKPDIGGYDEIGFSFYENTTTSEADTIGIASLTILIIPSGKY